VKTSDAYEVGKIFEFLTGITTAGAVATDGNQLVKLDDEFPNLNDNMPMKRFSVMHVVDRVKRLQVLLKENGFTVSSEAMDELRDGLKEMEEYLEMNPSETSFLRNPFAEKLVENARAVEEKFCTELAGR